MYIYDNAFETGRKKGERENKKKIPMKMYDRMFSLDIVSDSIQLAFVRGERRK
jgi:hypothetical protein